MSVKSKFQDVVMVFEHSWICPCCQFLNVVKLSSPHTQQTLSHCRHCKMEYIVQLELKTKKQEMAEKIGNAVLSVLVPGY